MRPIRIGLLALGLSVACSADDPPRGATPAKQPAKKPAKAEPVAPPVPEPEPAFKPLTDDVVTRLQRLAARFGGGKNCDTVALADIQALREEYGTHDEVKGALVIAFKTCDEVTGLAALLEETLSPEPTAHEQLALGAALIRAARYEDAVSVLAPVSETEGPDAKASWLYAFALFHAGDSTAALPLLKSARAESGGNDAALLIGLAELHEGNTEAAVAQLEQGLEAKPDDRSILAALGRAYTAAGRPEDASKLAERTKARLEAVEVETRTKLRLSALSSALRAARQESRYADANKTLEKMLALAPADLKPQLLEIQIEVLEKQGLTAEANAARKAMEKLK